MSHSSSGNVLLHDPTSHRRNKTRRSSPAGRVALAVAVAVAGTVPRGMSASTVLIMSVLKDSQPEGDNSVFPSPDAVTTFPLHGCRRRRRRSPVPSPSPVAVAVPRGMGASTVQFRRCWRTHNRRWTTLCVRHQSL